MKTARDLYHEQNPHHCLLSNPEDENGMSSHRYECDAWAQRDRSVRADSVRKLANLLRNQLLNIADCIENGEMW